MITTMVHQTLSVRRRSIAVWSLTLAVSVVMMLAIYPSFAKVDIAGLLASYPEGLLEAFGIESAEQMGSPKGFLNAELFSMILPLAIVFLPIGIVSHCISAAEDDHHLDNLLCTPVGRWHVVVATALAALVALVVALTTTLVLTLLAATALGIDLPFADIAGSCFALLPLATLFGSIGLLAAGAAPGRGRAAGVAGGLTAFAYVISLMTNFSEQFHKVRWATPFHYYSQWLTHGINWLELGLMLALATVFVALAAWLFERRDIAS